MSFTFDTTIPAGANNPSNDQPGMQTNNISTNGILAVDHISFNTSNGGQHKQITFNNKNVPGAQTDPHSVLYTDSGTASTKAELFFRNQDATFPIGLVRSWALCSSAGITASQSYNVTSVTRNSLGVYSVVLTANAVNSSNFGVLLSCGMSGAFALVGNYTITGLGTFGIKFFDLNGNAKDPASFTFVIWQL